jgi:hypothetical protein
MRKYSLILCLLAGMALLACNSDGSGPFSVSSSGNNMIAQETTVIDGDREQRHYTDGKLNEEIIIIGAAGI